MTDANRQAYAYRILRYVPNLLRDEWVNVGVVLLGSNGEPPRLRVLEEESELARLRRIHPVADLDLLRGLASSLEPQLRNSGAKAGEYIDQLDQSFSNALQWGPKKGILTADPESELDRLYEDQVAAPRWVRAPATEMNTPAAIRTRMKEVFRAAGFWDRLERKVSVEQFTARGDPFRFDCAYRQNGARGFVHALSLSRDPSQAKVLAYTAEQVRAGIKSAAFAAITEVEPAAGNERHQFVSNLLQKQQFRIVPVSQLEEFARKLGPTIG